MTDIDAPEPLAPLLSRMRQGEHQALKDLYQRTAPKLFAVALRIVRRRSLAEEVLQDAYISIWRNCGKYAPDKGSPLSWMAAIVRNRAIDLSRRSREIPVDLVLEDYDRPDTGPGPSDQLFQAEMAAELRRCLDQLPPEQRRMILSAYYEGHTHEQLAELSARPLGTIKTWIRRGLAKLRQCVAL